MHNRNTAAPSGARIIPFPGKTPREEKADPYDVLQAMIGMYFYAMQNTLDEIMADRNNNKGDRNDPF